MDGKFYNNMTINKSSHLMIIRLIYVLIILTGCKRELNLNDLAQKVVNSIQTQNTEAYYSTFPSPDLVAQYGIFAYGLYASSREDLEFWLRPYPQYHKSVDSLEKVTKPAAIRSIQQMFAAFHSKVDWNKVRLEGVDTTKTREEPISNLMKKKREKSIKTDMNIRLTYEKKKYLLVCRGTFYLEGKGWFLRDAPSAIELIENK
jgi:hypothetical protein